MLLVTLGAMLLVSYEAKKIVQLRVRYYWRIVMGFHLIPMLASLGLTLMVGGLTYSSSSTILMVCIPITYVLCYAGLMLLFGIIPRQRLA